MFNYLNLFFSVTTLSAADSSQPPNGKMKLSDADIYNMRNRRKKKYLNSYYILNFSANTQAKRLDC